MTNMTCILHRAWNSYVSCANMTGCTFNDLYGYRLSLGYWSTDSQRRYNSSIQTFQFICADIAGYRYHAIVNVTILRFGLGCTVITVFFTKRFVKTTVAT